MATQPINKSVTAEEEEGDARMSHAGLQCLRHVQGVRELALKGNDSLFYYKRR